MRTSSPARRTAAPAGTDRVEPHVVLADPLGVLHHHDRVGSLGHRRAGHDADGLAGTHGDRRCGTGREFVDDVELHRDGRDVARTNRVAVDCGVVERRHDLGGDDGRREHQAGCLVAVDFDGAERRARFEYERLGILERGHGGNVPQRPTDRAPRRVRLRAHL